MLKILGTAFDDAVSVFKNPTASIRNELFVAASLVNVFMTFYSAALTHSSLLFVLGITLRKILNVFGTVAISLLFWRMFWPNDK